MKKIFVVDDNTSSLIIVEEALSEHYDVFTLSSVKFMFDLLDKVTPDLILMDLLMPVTGGFEALKLLKESRNADIPVIILTSKVDDAAEAKGFELGAADFIRKPFSKPVLLDRIKAHVRG